MPHFLHQLLPDLVEVDNEWEENVDDSELISEEELEALIQQKIDSEKKQIEYDMEEKYEIRFRKQQVELMHTFDKKQQDLEKNFEKQVNHRLESCFSISFLCFFSKSFFIFCNALTKAWSFSARSDSSR
jgi:hypothetical protein